MGGIMAGAGGLLGASAGVGFTWYTGPFVILGGAVGGLIGAGATVPAAIKMHRDLYDKCLPE